jgi:thiol-disulfide isomerase/thioredoxin
MDPIVKHFAAVFPSVFLLSAVAVLASVAACAADPEKDPPAEDLLGNWRGVLASPGGELPFTLRLDHDGPRLRAVIVNGAGEAAISRVTRDGDDLVFRFDHYDSEIEAKLEGGKLAGRFRRTIPSGDSVLVFTAVKDDLDRFKPVARRGAAGIADLTGTWAVEFVDESSREVAQGELVQQGETVTGTFLTPTGDYRYLAGNYQNGLLRLSVFDGSHAFLFEAAAQEDGSLAGDFWSRESYHAKWTARRTGAGEQVLPDAWAQVGLKNADGRFHFEFPDLEGKKISLADPRFRGKVVVVNLFGSWCPNCNDEAPLLSAWSHRFRDQGLEIVGLAFEYTGKPERDREQVRRYAARHAIDFPLLLAGTSDKTKAAAALPDLDRVAAFPTTIFVGRDGKVRKIHSGFAGPAAGRHHAELVAELESLIQQLLAEPFKG